MTASGVTAVGRGSLVCATGETTPYLIRYIFRPQDPFSITLRFLKDEGYGNPVEWTFARDLLAEALWDYQIHGEGDVTIWRIWPNLLNFRLEVPDAPAAWFTTTDSAARDCLNQSFALVPAGTEYADADVDAELQLILDGAG